MFLFLPFSGTKSWLSCVALFRRKRSFHPNSRHRTFPQFAHWFFSSSRMRLFSLFFPWSDFFRVIGQNLCEIIMPWVRDTTNGSYAARVQKTLFTFVSTTIHIFENEKLHSATCDKNSEVAENWAALTFPFSESVFFECLLMNYEIVDFSFSFLTSNFSLFFPLECAWLDDSCCR